MEPIVGKKGRGSNKGKQKKEEKEKEEEEERRKKMRESNSNNKKKAQEQQKKWEEDESYEEWKTIVPVLYDWLANHNLVWPSLSCRYEATSSRKNRSLVKELTTGAAASVFLGFGSLFLLLASGVYV